jgi:uncharacterized protein YbaP (TraB family)
MKKILIGFMSMLSVFSVQAQRQSGLLWEITGNGLTKPSYVYGTMHVSDKVAFHLGDPFFKAIKSVDIVALEQNLDSVYDDWLAMYSGMVRDKHGAGMVDHETFKFNEFEKDDVKQIVMVGPLISNAILYRVDQIQLEFQEETYLDMLIYRLGKKYGKKTTGVEDMYEAERLTTLATAKEVRRKDAMGGYDEGETLSDFYRTGDLTAIDSLNKVMYSDNYLDYMLFKRNQNMVNAFEELRKGGSVFCGVGCAHLPGEEGVLRLLEKMGYTVKPVKSMSLKPSKQLEKSKKIIVTTPVTPQTSADNFFTANLPGKIIPIYRENMFNTLYVSLDVPAGSQYLVYRYQDFPSLRNKTREDVLHSIDSFIYEVVIGKIDKLTQIQNDPSLGRQSIGYDIQFTRFSGDKGRYKLIHTGSELVLIGVTGIKNFAEGKEASAFFGSFKLNNANIDEMRTITSPDGIVQFDAPAAKEFDGQLYPSRPSTPEFTYNRKYAGRSYITMYRNMYNGLRLRPDTTELLLASESFGFSHKLMEVSAEYKNFNGYPARYSKFEDKEGNSYALRVVLRGYKYFLQAIKGGDFSDPFFNNVKLLNPQVSGEGMMLRDTFMHFTANSPVYMDRSDLSLQLERNREESFFLENKQFGELGRLNWFSPNNDREFVELHYSRYSRYEQFKDSASFWKPFLNDIGYTNLQVISKKFTHMKEGSKLDLVLGDTGSSRRVRSAYILHGGEMISVVGFYDTISGIGNFTKQFIDSYVPVSESNVNVFESKVPMWVGDINSKDSSMRRKAWDGFDNLYVDSNHAEYLVKVYDTMQTSNQLVDRKRSLIYRIGATKSHKMLPVLTRIYRNAGDTSAYQTAVIGALGSLKSVASYKRAKELFFEETPVPDSRYSFNIRNAINDSLKLAAVMFPDLFDVMNIEEYKNTIVSFAAELVDSNFLKPEAYKSKLDVLTSEANILVKKVLSSESSKKNKSESYSSDYYTLENYIKLLLPFKNEPKVGPILEKAKNIKQRQRRMDLYVLMLKHGYPVEDSVFNNLAAEREHSLALYRELEKINRLDKYPTAKISKSVFSKNAYYNYNSNKYINGTSTEIDTIYLLDSAQVRYWDNKTKMETDGWIYLVKYDRKKKKSSYDEGEDNEDVERGPGISVSKQFYYGVAGPQPLHKDSINAERFMLNSDKDHPVMKEEKQSTEFKKLIRRSQIDQIAPGFYGFDWSERFSYMSEE